MLARPSGPMLTPKFNALSSSVFVELEVMMKKGNLLYFILFFQLKVEVYTLSSTATQRGCPTKQVQAPTNKPKQKTQTQKPMNSEILPT